MAEMDRPIISLAEKPKDSLGAAVPAGDNAVEILAVDGVVRRLNNRRKQTAGFIGSTPRCDVSENQHCSLEWLRSRRESGAPLSSIGISVPSLAMRIVWFAKPTILLSRNTLRYWTLHSSATRIR
jgi:hypothetical protein